MSIGPPYKSKTGGFYTAALFLEGPRGAPEDERPIPAVFSLTGREGYVDARKTFVALEDPTGYQWSQTYLKSWPHFQILLKSKWFREHYEDWLEELKIIIKQRALLKIKEIAAGDSAQALPAAKYLATADWEKATHNRGRPSREEVRGELAAAVRQLNDTDKDIERIGGLTLIQGGKS
jgi:hypothetical protein